MMVLVTQGEEAACSAAKAIGTRAAVRRRRVLVNCIVVVMVCGGCVVVDIGDCLLE